MYFFKRVLLYMFIILLVVSIYKDLSLGTAEKNDTNPPDHVVVTNSPPYEIMQIKVAPGDTLLSIVESINVDKTELDMNNIMNDFKELNPNADPYTLQQNTFYYFPVYH